MKDVLIHPEEKTEATPLPQSSHRSRNPMGILAACCVLAIVAIVLGVRVRQISVTSANLQTQLTQSKSETARAKSDLNNANAVSAGLQSQLDQAGNQRSSLQAQLDKSAAQSAGLQSQLAKAKTQTTDLQSQLDGAKAQLAGSETKLNQANAASLDLKRQLDEAKTQSADLQSQLQKAENDATKLPALAPKAAPMPVTTAFAKAFLGRTQTLHIKNTNPGPLNVTISVNGSENAPPSQSATIKSGDTFDVTKLSAGETVVIASEGYEPVTLAVR